MEQIKRMREWKEPEIYSGPMHSQFFAFRLATGEGGFS